MKTSAIITKIAGTTTGKIMMVIALATVVCGSVAAPSFADDHHGRDRGRSHHRVYRHHYAQQGYPYYYAQPVYAPPVYYAPEPSPGVSLFFPINIR